MRTALFVFVLLLPTFTFGAEENINRTEETFVLPASKWEACLAAKELIGAKRNLPDNEILAGGKHERYLENLVRVCADLPLYANAKEARASSADGLMKLPIRNSVFRIHRALAKKLSLSHRADKLKGKARRRFEKRYGPPPEIPALRYCRTETVDYLERIGHERQESGFTGLIDINSALRPAVYQRWLQRKNPNAIGVGAIGSTHPTGATVDLGYRSLSAPERQDFETRLVHDERAGHIQATKEHHQAVYHVMVFPKSFFENLDIAEKMLRAQTELAAR